MGGNYTHTSRASGLTLTAAIYNADHENHITNATPAGLDDYSTNATEMQAQTDPGEQGTESLSTSLAGELERLRYAIAEIKGTSYWYESAVGTLSEPSSNHIIFNTGFQVWQALATTLSTNDASSATPQCMDGWRYSRSGAGRATISKDTSVKPTVAEVGSYIPASAKILVTTDDASIGATDFYAFIHPIEGYYAQTIVQRTFTLSFWVRSAVTGTFCVAFQNSGNDRSYVAEYTISQANTMEYKTITVSASPTAGTWDYTNGVGVLVIWTLAGGSNYQTTAGSWATGNYLCTANQGNLFATNSNTFYLAAPKITPGPSASRWLAVPFQVDLLRAQRYYEKSWPYSVDVGTAYTPGAGQPGGVFVSHPTALFDATIPYFVEKRADPSETTYDALGASGKYSYYTTGWNNGATLSGIDSTTHGLTASHTTASSIRTSFQWVVDARL